MGKRRKRLVTPAAVSIAAAASLAGAPSASAQEVCVICEPGGPPGHAVAFDKHLALGFPGATEFNKLESPGKYQAFSKVLGTPAEDVFFKFFRKD
jgi:hypothetical protein